MAAGPWAVSPRLAPGREQTLWVGHLGISQVGGGAGHQDKGGVSQQDPGEGRRWWEGGQWDADRLAPGAAAESPPPGWQAMGLQAADFPPERPSSQCPWSPPGPSHPTGLWGRSPQPGSRGGTKAATTAAGVLSPSQGAAVSLRLPGQMEQVGVSATQGLCVLGPGTVTSHPSN